MNLLERARQFAAGKTSKIAATLLPLAAVMISVAHAQAGSVGTAVVFNAGTCAIAGGSGSCNAVFASSTGSTLNADWVEIFTTQEIISDSAGAGLSGGGSASGHFAAQQKLPFSWDFYFDPLQAASPFSVNWNLALSIVTQSGTVSRSESGTALASILFTHVTGNDSVNIGIFPVQSWNFTLTTSSPGNTYGLIVPGGETLDLNPVGFDASSSATPEPATMAMAAGSLGLLALLRRRKRA